MSQSPDKPVKQIPAVPAPAAGPVTAISAPKSRTVTSLRRFQVFGVLLVLLLAGGLGGWAALASISGAVVATAQVVVESNTKTVQHLEGGIVAEIRVRNGDRVQAGDVILRLDDTETKANLGLYLCYITP